MTLQVSPSAFLLRQIGEVLFGSGWQQKLADEVLQVSDRTVRAWASGEAPIPNGVWVDIYRHSTNLRDLLDHYNQQVLQLVGDGQLSIIPNSEPLPDVWGVRFALRTGSGRPVRCFISRAVLEDRGVNFYDLRQVVAYFNQHIATFHQIAQRKFLAGEIANDQIVIQEADVEPETLPRIAKKVS